MVYLSNYQGFIPGEVAQNEQTAGNVQPVVVWADLSSKTNGTFFYKSVPVQGPTEMSGED